MDHASFVLLDALDPRISTYRVSDMLMVPISGTHG